jgi:hypothetical protein
VQWSANLAENVNIDLYKGGVLVGNLAANVPCTGAYKWSIPFTLAPGSDYSLRISSTTNSALVSVSALPFSIVDPPSITAGSVVRLPNGQLQFGITAPGAASATVLVSTNLSTWQTLQSVTVTNNAAVFTDDAAAGSPARFYRLSLP